MSQTWFITGTSTGIGWHLTERLLARGDRVAATVRRAEVLQDLKARHGDRLWLAPLDVTDLEGVRDVMARAFADLGRIDTIVSNAGYGLFGAGEEVSDVQIKQQLDTNLLGSIAVIRAALPHLRAQGGGRIMQVSSEGGQIAYPSFGLYHATKWGIEGFVEAVAQEVAPFGITCTIVEPGPAATGFSTNAVRADAMEAYAETPAGAIRRALLSGGFAIRGDADKMAQAMIDCADSGRAPRRLLLGAEAYGRVHAGLTARLAELEAQKDIAFSTERDV